MLQDFLKVIPLFCTTHHQLHIKSKVVVIFTGCFRLNFQRLLTWVQSSDQKEVKKAPFVVQMLMIVILITLHGYSLNSPQSFLAKLSFEAKIVPLLSFCNETGLVTPLFYMCCARKIHLKEKKPG